MLSSDPSLFDVLPLNAGTGPDGRLEVAGCSLVDIASEFGTPAFVVDVGHLRQKAREYRQAFLKRHHLTRICFAAKAFPCSPVLNILAGEGIGCDVTSAGELAIALHGGINPELMVLHGNAKSDHDLTVALEAGVGLIAIDSLDDVARLRRLSPNDQDVMIRVNPNISGETHSALDTGSGDSKFGVAHGQVAELIRVVGETPGLNLQGLHFHIGSQLLDMSVYGKAAETLKEFGPMPLYDLGGGLGVGYRPGDSAPSVDEFAEAVVRALHEHLGSEAELIVEPGRSMVARSCLTLYSTVTIKTGGGTTHVAIDGGMSDNLEVALYDTDFSPFVVDQTRTAQVCDVVGQHCESGDVLARDIELASPRIGDIIGNPCTGAYCYSLMNNYNGALKPPVVFCEDGDAKLAVRRETLDDLLHRDQLPASSKP